MMIPSSLHVMPKQERKILKALRKCKGCRIKVKKCAGPDRMLLTPAHVKRLSKAAPGSVVSLPFQHKHLVENSHHEGGFLHLLAAILEPVLGGVAGGLLGKGIGIERQPQKKKKSGSGMYLNPWRGVPVGRGVSAAVAPWSI